jgi:hypothetical protein
MEICMTLGLRFRSRRMGIASIFGALLVASATLSIVVVHGTTHAQVVNRPFSIQSARVQPRVLANGTVDLTLHGGKSRMGAQATLAPTGHVDA